MSLLALAMIANVGLTDCPGQGAAKTSIAKRVLWTNQPVTINAEAAKSPRRTYQVWERNAYPIGNGRLGGTIFGEPQRDRIQFNEDSLWVGNEDCTGGYQPFGDIYIETPHAVFSDYRRELDISRAVHTTTYTSGGTWYKREYFSSHPAQVMVLRRTADKPAALDGKISMGNEHEIPITTDDDTPDSNTLVMTGDTSKFWWWQVHLRQPKRLLGSREYASDQNIDMDLEARVQVLHEGGTVRTVDNKVIFDQCDSITILLAADTSYLNERSKEWKGPHPHQRVSAQLAAAAKRPYSELLAEHVADYQRLYGRLALDLGDTAVAVTAAPTPDRVKAYAEQVKKSGTAVDRDLEALLYQYARYLMISCSRPGGGALPANLQGLWLISRRPAWRCDYHTDINLQMNYWFTGASNLAECFIPVAEWIESIREVRMEETRKVLGVERGWLMRSENGVFGGSTWHFQKGDSAWLCQNLWDHYAFTQDRSYLEDQAYPIMKEISEFWVDHLKELPDGTLVAPDGRSPEHGPEKADGVTYDQQLCWDLFTNMIEASEVLGVDAEYRKELIAKRGKLMGPKIGKWGQLQEWMEDIDDPKDNHRHNNHLIGIYPGRQIHPNTTPGFAEAAKVSVIARGNGRTGWSKAWKVSIFARLLDAERAYAMLSDLMASKLYGNLWTTHPPFQIDCNFGFPAGVNALLVQSHLQETGGESQRDAKGYASRAREVHLLPALPATWSTGSIKGMRVRGGYELDMAWKDGQLSQATLRGVTNTPGKVRLRHGKGSIMITLDRDESRVIKPQHFSGIAPVAAPSNQPSTIDAETIRRWSEPYRNWHYHPDHVIAPKPDVKGYESVGKTDVPTVFQLPGDRKWYMSFIGFDGKGYQSFLAESDDLVHWSNLRLAMGYGSKGSFDHGGVVLGAYLYDDYDIKAPRTLKRKDGEFYSLYGAYPRQGGYELRPGYEGVASSVDGKSWKRAQDEPILSVHQKDCGQWEKDCIYQPWLLEHEGRYYNYYNAAEGSVEQMGLAFSDDLLSWKRHAHNPVIPNGPKGSYNEKFSSDGKVFRDRDHWICIFFGVGKGGAHIMAAHSRDLHNWTVDPEPLYKSGGNPSGLDRRYAHKISLVWNPANETFYMFYNAVGNKGRGIGLITSKSITNR